MQQTMSDWTFFCRQIASALSRPSPMTIFVRSKANAITVPSCPLVIEKLKSDAITASERPNSLRGNVRLFCKIASARDGIFWVFTRQIRDRLRLLGDGGRQRLKMRCPLFSNCATHAQLACSRKRQSRLVTEAAAKGIVDASLKLLPSA